MLNVLIWYEIDLINKSHNAPVPYPTMHHSEQKCAHFCYEWCIVGYETGALWDFLNCEIGLNEASEASITNTKVTDIN